MSSSLQSLIRLMENRLQRLSRELGDAELAGDANRVAELEAAIADAETTLNGLRTLE